MELPTQDGSSIKHKRNRTAQSCVQCRLRKVRCDRKLPCAPCLRSRSSLSCSYDKRNTSKEPRPVVQNIQSVARQGTPFSLSSNDGTGEDAAVVAIEPGATAQGDRLIEDLQRRVRQLEEIVLKTTDTAKNSGSVGLSVEAHMPREQPLEAPTPRLRNAWSKTKIFGPNNWLQTAEQFQVLGEFIASDLPFAERFKDRADLLNTLRECISLRRSFKKQVFNEAALPPTDISSTFPQKPVCDELVQNGVYIFWEDPQLIPDHFKIKLALVLAIGSAFYSIQDDLTCYQSTVQNWVHAGQLWLVGPSSHADFTNDGLQIGCLLILSRLTGPASTPTWISTASLLQMGLMMGLHRDSSLFPSLTPFQVETRNRLWATIIELSVQALLDSGVPLPLSLDEFDSRGPSNINDHDISPESNTEVQPKGEHIFTDSSIQILLRKSINMRLEVARLLNDPLRKNLTFDRAMKLGQELRAACREISAFFQLHTSTPQSSASGQMEFHRKLLDMYLHRYIFFLYRPFMIEARKNLRYYVARKMCVESCLIIASHCEDAPDPSLEMGNYIRLLNCVGSGTFKGPLCMDVIAVLGLELVMQVEEDTSLRSMSSRHTAAIDPLSEMNKANRAPLIRCLDRIKNQLEQIIVAGRVSLKRVIFLVGLLSLVRAIDCGLPIQQTIFGDIMTALREYYSYLSGQSSDQSLPEPVGDMASDPDKTPDLSTFFATDDWDPSSIVFPDLFSLLEPSSARW
ncbi:C6 transcription factor, putative [Talaromyces stipitatus ATCC 10500]|uniref:C6 transcription factor, putative n=1 Tax=Talaromyces stipitatus (strain ATCC 10500 / CBS 375.48 / QM 6759 / NRRL 1006) TaxID=441959 RepID=B8MGT1_TALSN|nr:C6 transcription factor, putative [Talaromyces stipitatus ATCC 10500]EED16312.1 C6 transcription factor, putative [Talaromyces stipitatus ATCC 10500]